MKIISVFNNKGGVGKSTLTFHLGHSLAELDYKVLLVDLDPQCNLTLCSMRKEDLHSIWEAEDKYIDDFESNYRKNQTVVDETRSIHFLLKPSEDGVSEINELPPPKKIDTNIDLIPGRLSLHKFENKIAERWAGLYQGDNLSIRTITNVRSICKKYAEKYHYDYIIIDTSPSLGILNKVVISTVDGFFIPAQPDMFSLYGIQNIGSSLNAWKTEFEAIYNLLKNNNPSRRKDFPNNFVQFLGYSIYNAKKYNRKNPSNEYSLAQAHYHYVNKIPDTILKYIPKDSRKNFDDDTISKPIGKDSIIHSHNTFPAMAQALQCPMWQVPEVYSDLATIDPDYIQELSDNGFEYNQGNNNKLKGLKENYKVFTESLISRINLI